MSLWSLYHSMNFSEVFQPDHQSNVDPYKGKGHWLRGQDEVRGKEALYS